MPSSILQKVSNCTKYPGHEEFIPLNEFSPQHLRAVRQKSELYDLIKCQGALTLKVKCRRTKKVKVAGKSAKHTEKQRKAISLSTGFVIWVNKRTAGIGQSCHCHECILNQKDLDLTHDEWYELIIITNSSTVSNKQVADSIEVEVSLNEGQEKTGVLKGNCKYVELNEDIRQLHFITCDLELGSKLRSHFVQFENLLSNAFSLISKKSEYIFSFTVSHPHGCDKHVSFSFEKDFFHSFGGTGRRMMEKNKGCVLWPSIWNNAKVYYNVPTCAGSSGAIVITLTRDRGIIISLHQSGSKRYSWTKETNVRHFSEFLKEDEEPDRLEDFGPMVTFPSRSEGEGSKQSLEIEEKSEVHPMSKNDQVTVLQPRDVSLHRPVPPLELHRIVPRRITPRRLIDDEIKETLQEPKAFESNTSVIESKERILQLKQVPETTKLKPPASKDVQFGLLSQACQSNQELKTPELKSQPSNNEMIVSPASQDYGELKTSESNPSLIDNEILSPTSQSYQVLKTSESMPSPSNNDRIILPASQVYQDLKTSESIPSPSNNERIVSSASQDYEDLKTSESQPACNDNERLISPASQSYEKSKTSESDLSLIDNETLSLKSQGYLEPKISESNLLPCNDDRIVLLTPQSCKESGTSESDPSPCNCEGIVLSTCQANCKFKPKQSESVFSPGRDEGVVSLASSTNKKLEACGPSHPRKQGKKRHLPLNQSEDNSKALQPSTTARTEELVLSAAMIDLTKPGMAESEVCYGPEAHLPLLYIECEKHPGHEKFFHLGELKLDHLPEKHREEDIFKNIHHTAALTVKVKTTYVSRKRPEAHPHTGDPYLFSEQKGQKFLRMGTGFIVNAQQEKVRYGQTCQCVDCESSKSTRYECYQVVVMTATHVVFDQAEANRTVIEFSYYQNDKEVTTKFLKGKCKHCVINEDACWLEYSTHDEILVSKLRENLEQFQKGRLSLSKNTEHDGFVTIVSHPHGSTKQHVSFGNILSETDILSLKKEDSESADTTSGGKSGKVMKSPAFQFYHPFDKVAVWPGDLFKPIVCQQISMVCYTTPTCRGSSGALVCVHKPGVGNIVYTHWGSGDEEDKYNRSGGGTVFYLNDNQIFPS